MVVKKTLAQRRFGIWFILAGNINFRSDRIFLETRSEHYVNYFHLEDPRNRNKKIPIAAAGQSL